MWKDKLKATWNEKPLEVISVGAVAVTTAVAVLNALSAAKGRRAYAKQVNYRVKNKK